MSVDYSAHTVIGLRISKEIMDNQDKLNPDDFDYLEMSDDYHTGRFGNYYGRSPNYYIGIMMSDDTCDGEECLDIKDIDFNKIKSDLKAILDQYDLYDETQFGIWTVLNVS